MSSKKVDLEFLLKVLYLTAEISYTDCIWWRADGDHAPVSIFVNCNDKFEEGIADCEEITPNNIHLLEEAINEIREVGGNDEYAPLLFCAKLRRTRPQGSSYPRVRNMWPLFDRVGPAREKDSERPSVFAPIKHEPEEKSLKDKLIEYWHRFIEFIKKLLRKLGIVENEDLV